MSKSKIVFLSDIHIGTNSPTVWYQKNLHESYLITLFDWVINNSAEIRELILLGDIVDFWTYPCEERPPEFRDIMKAHPNIFGDNDTQTYGKLSDVLNALEGKVSYVRGNHDMTITQEDLNEIQNPQGYKITLQEDIYFPLGKDHPKLVCTHGHHYTMFNEPYSNNNPIAPLPLGFYITRSVASMRYKQIIDDNGGFRNKAIQSVADLPSSGDPDPSDMGKALTKGGYIELIGKVQNMELASPLLNAISDVTGIKDTDPIKLTDGSVTTIEQAKRTYENLGKEWKERVDPRAGFLFAAKSAFADLDGSYLGWFAQKLAFETGADLVVMGHTHKPILGIEHSSIGYVNTGFSCPSKLDLGKKHPTFVVVDHTKITCEKGTVAEYAEILQVVAGAPNPQPYPAESAKVNEGIPINYYDIGKLTQDFSKDCSCYVEIDNTNGQSDLFREDFNAKYGNYVVAPPQRIAKGEIAKFWLQDPPITEDIKGVGAESGWVKYGTEGSQSILFEYSCPYGTPNVNPFSKDFNPLNRNECSVKSGNDIKLFTRTDGYQDWGQPNEVKTSGHPFFAKFVL